MILDSILSLFHQQFVKQRFAIMFTVLVLCIAVDTSITAIADSRPNVVLIISDD